MNGSLSQTLGLLLIGWSLGWLTRSYIQRRIDRENSKAILIGENCLSNITKIIEQRKFTGTDVQITSWCDYSAGPFGDFRINIVEKQTDENADEVSQ